jgi:hypothetical protein
VPSVCDLLGLQAPPRNLCGRSYVPLAEVKELPKNAPWRIGLCARFGNTSMARENRYKLVSRNDGQGPNEIYDLVTDPTERENQAANPQFATVRNELAGILDKWTKDYSTATPVAQEETGSKKKKAPHTKATKAK